jgi:REP element-mobilizing transposase RayT
MRRSIFTPLRARLRGRGRRRKAVGLFHGLALSHRTAHAGFMHDEDTPLNDRDHLPRLGAGAYRGRAIVHWTLTAETRGTGWLDDAFHVRFRWLLLHGCARYEVACPVYCLMPDHAHLLVVGWSQAADQRLFMPWLRKQTNLMLKEREHAWQKQAHDHVLRPQEADRYAFLSLVKYLTENPVRAGLVKTAPDWRYTGSVVPGYPELEFWAADYWERYERIVAARAGR